MALFRFVTAWRRLAAVTAVLIFTSAVPAGQARTFLQSGPEQVALVELYTSQGCSSCPPADQWLSRLKESPGLWDQFVPLAFHVDYWDYIGWQDRFAQASFGQRQRQYAKQGGARTVYTPGMMLNGKDWWGWREGSMPRDDQHRVGTLTVGIEEQGMLIRYLPSEPGRKSLRVYLALLGFEQQSHVTAGENRGRKLNNEFIVVKLIEAPLERKDDGYFATVPVFAQNPQFSRLAIAAWVSEASKQIPLQAVGGWLSPPP